MFHRLFKFFFRQQSSSPSKFQAFILEPILTPSGIADTEDWSDAFDVDTIDLGDDLEGIPLIPPDSAPLAFESGYFTVGESGEVGIDFLFDSGKYKFELAIFSLEDLDETPGSEAFIQEAARRALTNSSEGYTVIRDRLEGARFDGDLGEGKDWNSGEYKEIESFKMEAGTQFGMMLVPNGTIEDVYENPNIGGSKAPLFSLSTANPDDALHLGQIADVTGDGNTFVMEDVQQGHKWFDRDYNDLIFQVRGAKGEAIAMDDVVDPGHDWRETDMGEAILDYAAAYEETQLLPQTSRPDALIEDRPFVGIIDTGFSPDNPDFDYENIQIGRDWIEGDDNPFIEPEDGNEAGTHRMGIIGANSENDLIIDGLDSDAPLWIGRADADTWSKSLTEFVNTAIESEQPNAVVNVSIPFVDVEGNTRYELTEIERDAIAYAQENNVILVVAVGDDGDVPSALAQASQEFDNIITVGSSEGLERVDYSNFGNGLDILTDGGTEENPIISTLGDDAGTMAGTGVAAAYVTGVISQVWAVNPDLSYQQVLDILGKTARDIGTWGEDGETGAGLLNIAAAVNLAAATNADTYIVDEDWEEIEYIKGYGNSENDRPSREPNYLPQNLRFIVDRFYNPAESVAVQGKVKDYDGLDDLERVEFFLQKDGGEWVKVGEENDFDFDPYTEKAFRFKQDLGQLEPGNYRLQTVPYDDSGIGWEMGVEEFTILSVPEGEELSDRVKASIARSLNLESYDPVALSQTTAWIVSVQAGQDVKAFAEELGTVNIGATGQIANTYRWEFPRDRSPQEVAESLKIKGIEFAYPLVPLEIEWHSPGDRDYVQDGKQWHLNSGNDYDSNVLKVWEDGILGNGSVIGFIDSGFELDDPKYGLKGHPDLIENYRSDLSWDFAENDAIASRLVRQNIYFDQPSQAILYEGQDERNIDDPNIFPVPPKGHNYFKFFSNVDVEIADLWVDLDIDYEDAENLEVYLVSPSETDLDGIRHRLQLNPDGNFSGDISAFNGEKAKGKWMIEIIDNDPQEGKSGSLKDIILRVNQKAEDHGTKVAGVAIAGANNDSLGTGVAPAAEWAALRIELDFDDDELAEIFYDPHPSYWEKRNHQIDIYNSSWGRDFYVTPDGDSHQFTTASTENAIEDGAKYGREGLGNIYIFAAGNAAANGANVNYNSLANSRHSIAVAAIDFDGKHPSYSAPGSPVLVSAYANSGTRDSSDRPIVTTGQYSDDGDDSNDYTISAYQDGDANKKNLNDFGGTSAAAPFVSGVVALMLDARPDDLPPLTWRDIQHILIESATREGIDDPDANWTGEDGDRLRHSDKYGFGVVDAEKAVELAKTWTIVGQEASISSDREQVGEPIPNAPQEPLPPSKITLEPEEDITVEWVEVFFNGEHSWLGDLTLILTSPNGTQSVLAKQHFSAAANGVYNSDRGVFNWTFTSARHWGESATGEWTLQVIDENSNNAMRAEWESWQINVYGTKKEPIPDNSWIRQMGTRASDHASGVTVDDNGNVYVVGSTHGNLDGNTHTGGYSDPFITKYDVDGNKVWTQQAGSTGFDYYTEVAVDKAGNVYALGYDDGPGNAGIGDHKFVKYDADGNLLWEKLIGTNTHEWASGLKIDSEGNVVIAGWTQGTFGDNNFGNVDVFVAKYDSDGNPIWIEQKGTAAADRGRDVAVDADGNIYVVGITEGDLGGANAGKSDIFITKYDVDGNEVWTKQYGTTTAESPGKYGDARTVSVDVDSDGKIYISGETSGDLNGEINSGATDVFVMKLDEDGEEIWTRQTDGAGSDRAKGIRLDKEGNVYLAGWTNSIVNDEFNTGHSAFWVKYDSDGNLLDTEVFATSQQDIAQDIEIDRSGNVYLAGYTQGDLGAENAGDRDFWVSKNYIQPSVTITTNQTTVNEDGDPISITISRTGDTEKALTVNLDIAGSAVNGEDFEALPETVEIPAGQSSFTIKLTPKEDLKYEPDENISVNVSDGLGYKLGEDNAIAVKLIDNEGIPKVALVSGSSTMQESDGEASFTIRRNSIDGIDQDITVNYAISGTASNGEDYESLTGSVVLKAGEFAVDVPIKTIDDGKFEEDETIVINLADRTGYTGDKNISFSATITDDDPAPTVTLKATDEEASEDGNAAQFVVERTGDTSEDLTVHYSLAGEANNGEDYQELTGSVVIPAGATKAAIGVVPLHDYETEQNETVILNLTDDLGYDLGNEQSATATILNSVRTSRYGSFIYVNPDNGHLYILSEKDTWLGAQEQAEALGGNLVTINDQTEQDWLSDTFGNQIFSIGLTDSEIYGQQEGDFSWVNGEGLNYTNWKAGEPNNIIAGNEDFAVMNQHVEGQWNDRIETGDFPGIIEIDPTELDKPIVNFMVTDDEAGEDGNAGQIVVTRAGNLEEDLTVNYRLSGDATNGVDYEQLPETIVIPAGQSLATIPIIPVGDLEFEQNETVVVKLADGEYNFGTHQNAEIEIIPQSPVNRISNEVIGRDVSTLNYWENLLQSGVSPEQLRKDIIAAAIDTQGNFQAEEKIKEMYRDILQREATSQEVAEGRSQLENGATLSQLRQNLAGIVPLIDTLNPVYINPDTGNKYFLTRSDTWLGTQEQAEALGGNLVTINSESENQWLVDIFGSALTWIGATDSPIFGSDEGEYQWVNGEAIDYNNWSPGNPDNYRSGLEIEGEDFAHLNFGAPNKLGLWNDFKSDQFQIEGIVEIPNEADAGYNWTWTYFGEDLHTQGNNIRLDSTPNTDAAKTNFLANLNNVETVDFENFNAGDKPTTLNLGNTTVTLTGHTVIHETPTATDGGMFPTSGDKFLNSHSDTELTLDFSDPQSAFGFTVTDAEGTPFTVTLHHEDGTTSELHIPLQGTWPQNTGSALFYGVTDARKPFTRVTIHKPGKTERIGLDDLVIGDIKPDVLLNTATPPNQTLHLAYREDTPLNLSDILVTDPDGEATVKLTLSRPTEGSLAPATSGNVTSTYDPVTGIWQALGGIADINRLLADLQFTPRNNAHGSLDIATEITVGDRTHTGTIALTGIPINDRPTLTAIASFTGAKEGQPFTLTYEDLLAASDAKDIDNTELALQILSPSNGTLTRNNIPVASGTPLNPGETLVWTPDTSGDRVPAFRVKAFDGELYSESEVEVAIAVTPNDTPTLQVEPAQQWVRQLGGSGHDSGRDIAVDANNNAIVTGSYSNEDGFIAKYDPDGNPLWTEELNSPDTDQLHGVTTDTQGNIYAVGSTTGSIDGHSNLGGKDAILVKYDADGNPIWSKQVGTTTHDQLNKIISDDAGNLYSIGYTDGVMDGESDRGRANALLIKWDSDGNAIWTKQLRSQTSASTIGWDLVRDKTTGSIYIAGYGSGSLDGETNAGGNDAFIAKYDSDGNIEWNRQLGTSQHDEAYGIALDSEGNPYITGWTKGSLEGHTLDGSNDGFVAKYDKEGNLIWTEQYGTDGSDINHGIHVDENGQVIVTGHLGNSLDGNPHAGTIDAAMTGFDTNGNRSWSQQFGSPGWDILGQMESGNDGSLYAVGGVSGAVPGQTHAGSLDPIVAKYNHTQTYFANTPFDLNGIYVNDTEGDTVTVTLTLSDANAGTLTSKTTNDASIAFNAGVLTVKGSTEDVNAVLKDLQFNPATDYTETVTIATSVSDAYNNPVTGATMTLEGTQPPQFFTPDTPYLSFEDSPFKNETFSSFHLETFEDGQLNTPGLSISKGQVISNANAVDSVDADDGNIDGNGQNGNSWYVFGARDFTVTFDRETLGQLPTHAGFALTDIGRSDTTNLGSGRVIFEAFDASGKSLGTQTIDYGDNRHDGGTSEDRFLGVNYEKGISSLKISLPDDNRGGEIDHIQYGVQGENSAPTLQVQPTQQWARQLGSPGFDGGISTAIDTDGNIYAVGSVKGEIDGQPYEGSGSGYLGDGVLTKYNEQGEKLWTKTLGTDGDDGFQGVTVGSDGYIYVTGQTERALEGTNAGQTDYFTAKYSPTGELVWTRQLGTTLNDSAWSIVSDGKGNLYTVGQTEGLLDGNSTHPSYDALIIKWNEQGDRLWTRQMTGQENTISFARDLAYDAVNDDIIVTGNVYGNFDGQTSQGSYDVFVTRFNSNGEQIWNKQFGTPGSDGGYVVKLDETGNIYLGGSVEGAFDGQTNQGSTDAFLAKMDTTGNLLWTQQMGTTGPDWISGIEFGEGGQVYVAGDVDGALDGNTQAGSYDAFVAGFDRDGNPAWSEQFGTSGWDGLGPIVTNEDGDIYSVGRVSNAIDNQTYNGSQDILLVKYNHTQTYFENTPFDLNGIYVNDTEGDTLTVTLTLSDANAGTLTSTTTNDASTEFNAGVLTVEGSTEDVNAVLKDLQFNPATNYNQDIAIATTVTDGNSNPIQGQTMTLNYLDPTIVTNTNDRGIGSLRYALEWANQHNPGLDTITFNIPTTDIGYNPTTDTYTIQPLSALPEIQDPAILNATSQNGFNGTPIVEIDGSLAGDGADGFTIATSDTTIRGFVINRFDDSAIAFRNGRNSTIVGNYLGTNTAGTLDLGNQGSGISGWGAGNIIGGMNAGDRNLISGNDTGGVYISMSDIQVINNYIGTDITGNQDLGNAFGVRFHHGSNNLLQNNLISGNDGHGAWIDGGNSQGNIVQGNLIGTDINGNVAIANNGYGININGHNGSRNNIIGGTTPEARNLISGNLRSGINIQNSSGNTVQGNYIGTNIDGTQSLANTDFGIRLAADDNAIGGMNAGEGNLISGNSRDGIYVMGSGNDMTGNIIGADASGLNPLSNGDDGIQIGQDPGPANNNTVTGNAIAFNDGRGIYLSQGTGNEFSENSIHDNNGEGIFFKPGYNTNEGQPAPTLTHAVSDGTTTAIEGTLNADPNTTYRLEFFSDKDGEGKTFLGWQNVTTDGNGNAIIANNLPNVAIGEYITATATDPVGNTSMFSAVEVIDAANFIPLNHWNASFINRTYPSTADRNTFDFSNPVATLDLGEQAENGKLSLTRNWGDGSPDPAVQTDQYAMRAWTRTQFEAGQLYKITTRSDDGVWFHLKNTATGEWVGDSVVVSGDGADWRDRGTADAPRTIFFKVPESGEYDFHVDYYENTGGSVVDFTLEEAQPFQDIVNPQTQWETEFYWWDRKLGNQPPADIFANGGDPSSKIGTANLGSNIRSNGKSGLSFNWGANAALNDVRLPDNNYAILARTQATLEAGRNYQMHVQGDDGFQILARNRTTGQETFITPENQWQQAYGAHQVVQFSVPSDGQYDIEAQFYEERGDAYFDLSWEPINFSGRVISTINSNLRAGPSTDYAILGQVGPGAHLTFDKWTEGQFIDYTNQLGTASSRWYRIAGTPYWISAALIAGNP